MKNQKVDKVPEKCPENSQKSGQVGVNIEDSMMSKKIVMPNLPKPLSIEEKKYLLAVERGDLANVRRIIHRGHRKKDVNLDCVDPLGRSALTLAIDSENLEMVELLVVMGVQTKDTLLQAINVGFVEAVELLLEHEELVHKEGEAYSWEKVDWNVATFTPDITPLMLAAHRNNYEILKILLDRGATLPMPHDIRCGCNECIQETTEDSLRHSRSRINQYRALASPSLMALSSSDPILSAFQLSWDLRTLAFTEQESKADYLELRRQCQQFAVDLLSESRSSHELAIILNHDPDSPPDEDGAQMKLARLQLAISYKQKKFVAHPNIQQLLATMWYDGLPGFRRKNLSAKLVDVCRVALLFPFYCALYLVAPATPTARLMRKPFMKFLIHASSYLFFLLLLILVSQRVEASVAEVLWPDWTDLEPTHRGHGPQFLEVLVGFYVLGFIWEETVEIWTEGIRKYLRNLWNFIDFTRNSLYVGVFLLRVAAYWQQGGEIAADPGTAYIPRELWDAFDPQLIAEGLFAAANVFSAIKLVHLFSINPHLGPLQISLGRMVIDIVKFFFIYSLVLFAFACGLNQLLWYFAELERKKCYSLPGGLPDWENKADSCSKWRNFGNLFESTQSLFWASFGGIGTDAFQLTGIKTYTRFWGLLMFGSYSVINVIVLLNLLIAMMSNSYAMIDEHSDTEWKFARTKLWLSYFEESATLPPPFNIFPSPKMFMKFFGLRKKDKLRRMSTKRKEKEEKERDYRYTAVMRALVWRYISASQRQADERLVTEDDVNEIKAEISAMKCEILNVLDRNGMDVSSADVKEKTVLGKKMKMWERQLMKDFHVAPVAPEEELDLLMREPPPDEDVLSKFRRIAKLAVLSSAQQKWGQVIKGACKASQIGHCNSNEAYRNQQCLQKAMEEAQRLVCRSPKLASRSPSSANLDFPDTTGSSILELLHDFSKETEESPETRKKIAGRNVLLDTQKSSLIIGLSRNKSPQPTERRSLQVIHPQQKNKGDINTEHNVIIPSVSISPPLASQNTESIIPGKVVQTEVNSEPGRSHGSGSQENLFNKSSDSSKYVPGKLPNERTVKRPIKTQQTFPGGTSNEPEKCIDSALERVNDCGKISEEEPSTKDGKDIETEKGPHKNTKTVLLPPNSPKKFFESDHRARDGTGIKLETDYSTARSRQGNSRESKMEETKRSPPPSPMPDRKSSDTTKPTYWKDQDEPHYSATSPLSSPGSNSSQDALIPPSPPELTTPIRLKGQVKLIKRQPKEGWI